MILIQRATIVNEGIRFIGSVLIDGDRISHIYREDVPEQVVNGCCRVIDARGFYLIPGVIDDQVHFRDPGLTHKGDILSESRAAVAGGVTSYMDMPNTQPQTVTMDALYRKMEHAATVSYANYSFYLGATNENIDELHRIDLRSVCGIKLFMGASTGNMLVDDPKALRRIFAETEALIVTHCEEEPIIRRQKEAFQRQYGEEVPIACHPLIRSAEACYRSSAKAVELADRYGSRLHVLHLSTQREMSLFDAKPLDEKKITAEVCVHHLWFTDADYARLGARIKWNPAVKRCEDRDALRAALSKGKLDVVATDHAPHLLSEKRGDALQAASGGPLVQHSLQVMLELATQGLFTPEQVVEKMCHAPARLFAISRRGYIREGYFADLVLVDPTAPQTVSTENILYKCGWSPFEGVTFQHSVVATFVNGYPVFDRGNMMEKPYGRPLLFER